MQAEARSLIAYLRGRSGRTEYWISVALLFVVGIALAYANVRGASGATTFLWLLVWSRRLRDVGRTPWIAPIVLAAIAGIALLAAVADGDNLKQVMDYAQTGTGPVTEEGVWHFLVLALLLMAIQIGFTLWLGMKRGEPGPNAYGPPPTTL